MKTIGQICFDNVQQSLNAALGIGLAPSGGYGWGDLTPEQQRAWEKAAAATVAASPRPDTTPPMRTPGRVFYEAAQPKRREWNIDYDRLSGPSREALETGARAVLDAFPPGNLRDQLDHKLRMEQIHLAEINRLRAELGAARDVVKAPQATGTEAAVCGDIGRRQAMGIAKYGTTVADNPLSLKQWVRHAYEECLDQAVYLRRVIQELEKPKEETK